MPGSSRWAIQYMFLLMYIGSWPFPKGLVDISTESCAKLYSKATLTSHEPGQSVFRWVFSWQNVEGSFIGGIVFTYPIVAKPGQSLGSRPMRLCIVTQHTQPRLCFQCNCTTHDIPYIMNHVVLLLMEGFMLFWWCVQLGWSRMLMVKLWWEHEDTNVHWLTYMFVTLLTFKISYGWPEISQIATHVLRKFCDYCFTGSFQCWMIQENFIAVNVWNDARFGETYSWLIKMLLLNTSDTLIIHCTNQPVPFQLNPWWQLSTQSVAWKYLLVWCCSPCCAMSENHHHCLHSCHQPVEYIYIKCQGTSRVLLFCLFDF